jgi:hypothetical protein
LFSTSLRKSTSGRPAAPFWGDAAQRKQNRQQFIQELLTALPIHPVTVPAALRVGQIDGESQAKGVRRPHADLLIGVTSVVTLIELAHGADKAISVSVVVRAMARASAARSGPAARRRSAHW